MPSSTALSRARAVHHAARRLDRAHRDRERPRGRLQGKRRVRRPSRSPASRDHRKRLVGLDGAREFSRVVRRRTAALRSRSRRCFAEDIAVTGEEAERRLLALLNRDRQAAGLPALLWDDRVAAVSRAHSEDMRKTKVVAHISPTTGSAADRVRVAGIRDRGRARERRARICGRRGARRADEQPGPPRERARSSCDARRDRRRPRRKMLGASRDVLDADVHPHPTEGRDQGRRRFLVRDRIDKVRPVVVNATLQNVAQELAEGLAAGKSARPADAGRAQEA